MCYLYNTDQHKEMAKWLIDICPLLLRTRYSEAEYRGENCLHIAIVNRDTESIEYLLGKAPDLLDDRATGDFFSRKRFEESGDQSCYYGELPLIFAACTNQRAVVRYLVAEFQADLWCSDTHGAWHVHANKSKPRSKVVARVIDWGCRWGRPQGIRCCT